MRKLTLFACSLLLVASSAQAETVLETLQRLRSSYPTPLTAKDAGAYLNAVAWEHRGEKLALLGKKSGNTCPAPSGVFVSCDFLVYSDTKLGQDVLVAWDAEGRPSWSDNFVDLSAAIANGSRSVVEPVPPTSVGPPSPATVDLTSLLDAIAQLKGQLAVLAQEVRAQWAALADQDAALGLLQARSIPGGCRVRILGFITGHCELR